jgi:hypothetical protein
VGKIVGSFWELWEVFETKKITVAFTCATVIFYAYDFLTIPNDNYAVTIV